MKRDYIGEIATIKAKLQLGKITYEQAKEEAQPIIDEMNEQAKSIAEKYGKKHRPFTFAQLFR